MSESLLSVDVAAAAAKLSAGRLRGPEQVPVALARALARTAPQRLGIQLDRRQLVLVAAGRPYAGETFDLLAAVLDPGRSDGERQVVLERLETAGLLDLLLAFFAGARQVRLESGPPTGRQLEAGAGRVRVAPSTLAVGNRLEITGLPGRGGEMRRELERHLRYAPFAVVLDGRRLDRGLEIEGVFCAQRFAADGLDGVVGLPRRGLAARTQLVVDGVLERQIWDSPPTGAVWDAVVRCSPENEARALGEVSRQVAGLLRRLGARSVALAPAERERAQQLLFRLVDCGAGATAVAEMALFRDSTGRPATAGDLRRAARGRLLRAIGPRADIARYDATGPVFVLDERERAFVERHLNLVVREPSRRPRPGGIWRSWLRRGLAGAGAGLRSGLRRLAGGRPLPVAALDADENALAAALERILAADLVPGWRGARVVYADRRWGGWRWQRMTGGRDRLLLMRRHPRVRRLVAAARAGEALLYPALLLLADGRDVFGPRRAAAAARLAGLTDGSGEPTLPSVKEPQRR